MTLITQQHPKHFATDWLFFCITSPALSKKNPSRILQLILQMILRILCANNTGRDSFLKVQFILRTSQDCQILYFACLLPILYQRVKDSLGTTFQFFNIGHHLHIFTYTYLIFEFKYYVLCKIAIWIKLLLIFWLFWCHENVPHLSITWPTSEKTFY